MNNFENYLKRRIDNEDKFENLLKFPKYVEIETVNACNARCPMCTINDWERNYPIMKDEVFNKVSDDIIENKKHIKRVKHETINNSFWKVCSLGRIKIKFGMSKNPCMQGMSFVGARSV